MHTKYSMVGKGTLFNVNDLYTSIMLDLGALLFSLRMEGMRVLGDSAHLEECDGRM